jgi:hypothetical protein
MALEFNGFEFYVDVFNLDEISTQWVRYFFERDVS